MERRWSARTPTCLCEVSRCTLFLWVEGDNERLLNYLAVNFKRTEMFGISGLILSRGLCMFLHNTSFQENAWKIVWRAQICFSRSWMTLKWTRVKERGGGETWGKAGSTWHLLAKMVIFLSHLQHSGGTLEQRKYIESSFLFFSPRRTIIFSWLRTRVHIYKDGRREQSFISWHHSSDIWG